MTARVGAPLVMTICAAALATGLLVEASGRVLGTATPPLVMGWAPAIGPLAAVAALVLAAVVVLGPSAPGWTLAPLALAADLALNAARDGTGAWSAIFSRSFEAKNEYLPALGALSYGRRFFLDRFAELVSSLPVNVAGHPPGLLVALDAAGLTTPGRMAALCIACAALVPGLTWALARQVAPEHARTAGLLAALSPALLLFGTTSADAVYAALGTGAAGLLVARRQLARAAGAVALALAAFASWALLGVGAWAAILVWRREGIAAAARLAALCAVAVIAFNAALAGAYGYDPVGALRATEQVYRHSVASVRPYWFWVVGSPAAWALTAGLPIVVAALRRATPATVATWSVVAVATTLGFTKAETERVWLFLVPLLCVSAAEHIPGRRLRGVLALLAAQAFVTELLFYTVW